MTWIAAGTPQKTKAIDRLIWILGEATRRVKEEKLRSFTNGLNPLQLEMDDILKELGIHSPPFRLKREFIDPSDERSSMWCEITTFKLNDPTGMSSSGVLLCGRQWTDKARGTVRDFNQNEPELAELRQKTLITFRRWDDWLKAACAATETPSVDSRSLEFDEEHCQTCPTTPEQRKLVDLIASEKNRLSADDERLKEFTEGILQTLIANRFIVRREGFFECTPNGLRLFVLMVDQPVEETLDAGRKHFGKRQKTEAPTVTIEIICEKLCKQRNGRKTLKRILELTRQGDSPSDIARKNAGRGFSLPNISEQLTKVRDQFPDFLP
jgi:hypothetical protein